MNNFSNIIDNRCYLFFILFFYTLLISFFIQDILLPFFFPEGINSHGLLKNTDSINYHEWAILVSNKINLLGWHEWELFPIVVGNDGVVITSDRHFMVGFTSIFYALIAQEPWVMIPINVFFHVLTVFILIKIALFFTDKYHLALFSVTPYMFFPSACFWYSQLLKDVYFNFGVVMFCYGWMCVVFINKTKDLKISNILIGYFSILFGYFLMGCIRPFNFTLLRIESTLITIFSLALLLFFVMHKKINFNYFIKVSLILLPILVILMQAEKAIINNNLVSNDIISFKSVEPEELGLELVDGNLYFINRAVQSKLSWTRTEWIPISLDNRFSILSGMRKARHDNYKKWRYHPSKNKLAKSTIDLNIKFSNAVEILKYIPRAAQIGFFSPFPRHWLEEGASRSSTVMRKITMFEMLFIYITFLFVPLVFYYWREKPEFWVPVIYCSSMITLFPIVIPNIGSIYRYRYPYLMILVTIFIIFGYKYIYKNFFTKSKI